MPSLNFTHHPQRFGTDCVAACAQMLLANLGVNVRYRRLLNLLKVRRGAGASFYNLRFLDALGVSVVMEDGHMGLLEGLLAQNTPVIVAVNTVDLSY